MMWDNYDKRILEYKEDLNSDLNDILKKIGVDFLWPISVALPFTKRSDSMIRFQRELLNNGNITHFDPWYLSQYDSKPLFYTENGSPILERNPNPWLRHLNIISHNKLKPSTKQRYYYYAGSVYPILDLRFLANTGGFKASAALIKLSSGYQNDAAVPDFSGFFTTAVLSDFVPEVFSRNTDPEKGSIYYEKADSKKWRFIRDADHDLFRAGLHGRYTTLNDTDSLSKQKIFISELLKEKVPNNWQGDNAYDPLWFMVKQDLGYKTVAKPEGVMVIKGKNQNILTWKQKSQFAVILYTDKTTGKTKVLELTLDLGKADADGYYSGVYYHTKLPNDANYEYALRAKNKEGTQSLSVAELTPINFSVNHNNGINTLTWESIETAESYDIRYTSQAVIKTDRNYTLEEDIKTTTFEHKNIAKKTTWYYQLRYKNVEGDVSAWSAEISATSPDIAKITVPKNVKATAGDKQITLKWDSVTGATKYTLYFAEKTGVTPANYATHLGGKLFSSISSPYTVPKLLNDKKYSVVVTATNSANQQSPASLEVSATPKSETPVAPTGLQGSGSDQKITFSWNNVSNADTYTLYLAEKTGINPTNYTTHLGGQRIEKVKSPYTTPTNLVNDKKHFAVITATSGTKQSIASNEISATPQITLDPFCNDTTKYICSSQKGDPHLITFDRLAYSFQAVGEFILVKSLIQGDSFEVQTRYRPWLSRKDVSITQAVAVKVDQDRVGYYHAMTPPLRINGMAKEMLSGTALQLDSGGKVIHVDNTYQIFAKDGSAINIRDNATDILITARVPISKKGKLKGLFGNADKNMENDIATQEGTLLGTTPAFDELYPSYADSWRITQAESLFDYETGESTETFTDKKFPPVQTTVATLSATVRADAEQICKAAKITNA
ncbi:MAG: VWD domain-containing protein, partial [Gammaproteobacteria bacterium]|nr:VWD domain-containing protein [Gammaproteobacteria bacterium]